MWTFWLLFLLPAVGALGPQKVGAGAKSLAWGGVITVITVVVGFRHEVGGDWFNYADHFDLVSTMGFREALLFKDPGYYLINWLAANAGGSVYWVNFLCAGLLMTGVSVFARNQPLPWLALLVAVPYLIVVVAMGYTRQSAALGFALLGLSALGKQRLVSFVILVLVGALFHKSAVLLLPIAALAASKRRIWTGIWVGVTALVAAALLVLDSSEALWAGYIEADYQSEGGLIRVAMNSVPSLLFLVLNRKITPERNERRLWIWMAVLAILCLPLVLISSAAVDRVALYFIPLQIYVFSRIHRVIAKELQPFAVLSTMGYYAAVLWVWLNYASHAHRWVPYEFMPF